MSEQKKPAIETLSRSSQELDDQELDGVAGGLGIQIRFTVGHTVYQASVATGSDSPFFGLTGSLRGIASR